jgi:predicted ATPase
MAKLEADAVALDAQLTRPPANLPMPTSSFVGRERDVADVRERLRSAHIVTLVGTGGVGKTRLALHVASESLLDFDDGAWLCELGNLTDPASIPEAMAIALGLTQAQGKPVEDSVVDHLRDKRLLLIVDNCEHLVGAVAELLEEIARACPEVRVLATSREALAVEGEVTWPVRSLDAPPADAAIGPDALAKYEAVQLFVDRARAVRPGFDVDASNAAAVAEVCRRLDGIPLAIELAAARVRSMSPAEIRDRLDERFRLLTGGRRTALERHQTLRAAVTWSYELLTDEEQRLFRRLSVFAGSFDLEAAEAVPAAGDLASADILDLLSNLVAKSLVTVDDATAGVTRYRVLETLRQYGRERLDEAGEVVEVAARHAAYYAGLVARIGRGLRGPDEAVWMDRVEAELDNLRAASRWAVDVGDARLAIGLCAPILIWSFFGMPVGIEIGSWARAAVDMPGASDVPNFGDACMWAGLGEWWLGTLDRTIHYSQLALRAAESRGDSPNPIAYALRGMNVYVGGTWEAALEAFTDGARAARSWPDEAMVAGFLGTMGMALSVSRESDAAAFADEAVMLARRVGCPSVLATALCGLGQVYLTRDANRAITAYEEALALDNGQRFWTTLQARINLALIRVRRGDRAALTAIASIVRDLYRVGNMGVLVGDLSTATGLLADLGEDEATARVAGVVESGALGQMMLYQPGDAERVAAARARLGDIEFEAQKAIGASWADDEAIEQVCALLEALAVGGSSRPD